MFLENVPHLGAAVHGGGVVLTPQALADLRKGHVQVTVQKIHGNLAWKGHMLAPFIGEELLLRDVVVVTDSCQNEVGAYCLAVTWLDHVIQEFLNILEAQFCIEAAVGGVLIQSSTQLTDIATDVAGHIVEDFFADFQSLLLGHILQYGQTCLVVWGLDVYQYSAPEAGGQTLLHGIEFLGRLVAGQDDLAARFEEGVEGVEELLLGTLLILEKLDIIDEQIVTVAVLIAKGLEGLRLNTRDELVQEGLALDVDNLLIRFMAQDMITYGLEEMGLAEA